MAGPPSHMWYIRAAGRVWGPYPAARMDAFARESRVRAATPISPFAGGPFTPAANHAEFAPLLLALAEAGEPLQTPPRMSAPTPASVEERPQEPVPASKPTPAPEPSSGEGPVRTLLIWAELSAETLRAFPSALAQFGPGAAVRPGLWLLQARMAPSALRNLLSRRLGPSDSLLVVEAGIEQAAWFNLEPGRDRELRRLWSPGVRN